MAGKKMRTSYTFAVTIPDIQGVTIPELRSLVKDALNNEVRNSDPKYWADKGFDIDKVRIHLTNKEVKYGG